jgi:Ca2+-binding RTX toxin-like protein
MEIFMPILTYAGDRIGEALQFDHGGSNTTVTIGRVFFAATDTVTIDVAPGAFDPVTGAFVGGNGAIRSLTVTTASGQVTTFDPSPDGLDVDPDASKQGADIVYVSEAPGLGVGGAYAGLKLEKLLFADQSLSTGANTLFGSGSGQTPGFQGPIIDPGTALLGGGTPDNDTITGTANADNVQAGEGNDYVDGAGGNDSLSGGSGSDVLLGGAGMDTLFGDEGNDNLIGGADADTLDGGIGSDVLNGGAGADMLTGGADGDSFVFGPGGDTVLDFDGSNGDKIVFDSALGLTALDVSVSVVAEGTVITAGGESMLLANYFGPIDAGNDFKFDYVYTELFV